MAYVSLWARYAKDGTPLYKAMHKMTAKITPDLPLPYITLPYLTLPDRQTDRRTDRQTDRQRDRETDTDTNTDTHLGYCVLN